MCKHSCLPRLGWSLSTIILLILPGAGRVGAQAQFETIALIEDRSTFALIGDTGEVVYIADPGFRVGPLSEGRILGSAGSMLVGGGSFGASFSIGAFRTSTNFVTGHPIFSVPVGNEFAPYGTVGQQAPGFPTGTLYANFFGSMALNTSGQVAFANRVTDPSGQPDVMFAGIPGSIGVVARDGGQAADMPAGVTYLLPGAATAAPALNDLGQIAFGLQLEGLPTPPASNRAIYVGPIDDIHLLVRSGDSVSTLGGDATYTTLASNVRLNNHGHVAFSTNIAGTGISSANNVAVIVHTASGETMAIRRGDPVLGGEPGMIYANVLGDGARLNDNGQIFLNSSVRVGTDPLRRALVAGAIGSPQLIAVVGQQAPHLPTGVVIDSFTATAFNDLGQVAYLANLDVTGPGGREALYLHDPMLGDVLIVRTGELFDVGGGDLRRITDIGFTGGGPPFGAFNDQGMLAFGMTFGDFTSGIFTAVVPEPASLAMLLPLGLPALRRRG